MRIVVEIHHGIGDVVKLIPLFKVLSQHFPNAYVNAIVASEEHGSILKLAGCVSDITVINIHNKFLVSIKSLFSLRKGKYDIGIIAPMTTPSKGRLLMKIIGCKRVLSPKTDEVFSDMSIIKASFSALGELGISTEEAVVPAFAIKGDATNRKYDRLDDSDKRIIGICIGTGMVCRRRGLQKECIDAKSLPLEVTIELANKLAAKGNHVLLLGGTAEEKKLEPFKSEIDSTIVSYAGHTTIAETLSIISKCDLVIGGDTGIIHLADAIGVNTLVYYCASGPDVGPYSSITRFVTANLDCQYCYGTDRIFKCNNRLCINFFNSDLLFKEAMKYLNS